MLVAVGDLVDEVTSGDWGKAEPEADTAECVVIRATDFDSLARNDLDAAPRRFLRFPIIVKRRLMAGDLLVEMSGGSEAQPTGRVVRVIDSITARTPPVVFSNFVKRIRLKPEVDSEYFALAWRNLYYSGRTRPYEKRTTGIRNFRLDDFLVSEEMLVPPLDEQRRIARRLSAIQRSRECVVRSRKSVDDLGRSIADRLLTPGKVWRTSRLGDVLTLQRGNDLPKSERRDGHYPVVGANGVVGSHDTAISEGPGVLVGRSGSVGKVTWIPGPFWPLNTALWVKDWHNNDPRFVYFFLRSLRLQDYAAGVSVPTLNRNLLHPLTVRFPPIDEQQRIACMLSTIGRKTEADDDVVVALDQVLASAMVELLVSAP
jgi:type I restriction enzyme S subunit